MKIFCKPPPLALPITLIALLTALPTLAATAAPLNAARQDLSALSLIAQQFLQTQSIGLPGSASVEIGRIDPRLNLSVCTAPEAFLPKGNRAWGKTTVGIRCSAPSSWTIYVPATVKVIGDYYVAAAPLVQGQRVAAGDLAKLSGDLNALPSGIITDPSQAIGRNTTMSISMGSALRQDVLRSPNVVQQGQVVKIVSNGPGFQISIEGHSMSNAGEGQVAQAKTSNGQVISGIARAGGIIEINN